VASAVALAVAQRAADMDARDVLGVLRMVAAHQEEEDAGAEAAASGTGDEPPTAPALRALGDALVSSGGSSLRADELAEAVELLCAARYSEAYGLYCLAKTLGERLSAGLLAGGGGGGSGDFGGGGSGDFGGGGGGFGFAAAENNSNQAETIQDGGQLASLLSAVARMGCYDADLAAAGAAALRRFKRGGEGKPAAAAPVVDSSSRSQQKKKERPQLPWRPPTPQEEARARDALALMGWGEAEEARAVAAEEEANAAATKASSSSSDNWWSASAPSWW
jgi:hypothetical protein